MARSSRDGSLDLFADAKDRTTKSQRKPPRHLLHRDPSREETHITGKLTTFQKLDREMGRFVKAQPGLHCGPRDSWSVVSEEDSSQGLRHGVKWKLGLLFEQDKLYWESSLKKNSVSDEEVSSSSDQVELAILKDKKMGGHDSTALTSLKTPRECLSTSAAAFEQDLDIAHKPSTDDSSTHWSMQKNVSKSLNSGTHHSAMPRCHVGGCEKGQEARDDESTMLLGEKKGWSAVLKAKCEVLQMEKDIAEQRWVKQCEEMAQAAEMAHCLRASVETILETAKRGTVSAPCTPRRNAEADSICLAQRIQRLRKSSVQRDLENQAKAFQGRIKKLQLKSQIWSADSSLRKDPHQTVVFPHLQARNQRHPASTSSYQPAEVFTEGRCALQELELINRQGGDRNGDVVKRVKAEAEQWEQVQEVLRHVKGEVATLQESCEIWEKRALLAESRAASLQLEEEEWRVEAQRSQKKIKELEKEIVQGRARLEEGRSRHALEQSQLLLSSGSTLGPGNTLGYTLVLQPLVRNNVSNWCACSFASDAGSCTHCGDQCQGLTEDKNPTGRLGGPPHAAMATTPFDRNATCTAWGSTDKPPSSSKPITSSRTSSLFRDCNTETWEPDSNRKRCESGSPQRNLSTGNSEREVERVDCSRNLEVERSLSQKWFKQRPTNLKPSSSRCDNLLAEKHAKLGGTPLSTRTHGPGRGLKGPPSFRVPSSSPCEQRSPLTGLNPNSQLKSK